MRRAAGGARAGTPHRTGPAGFPAKTDAVKPDPGDGGQEIPVSCNLASLRITERHLARAGDHHFGSGTLNCPLI